MSKKQLDAILWRSYLTATSTALWGLSKSQYYFELPPGDYVSFFGNQAASGQDPRGNTVLTIQLEPFEGAPPVVKYELKLTKLRDGVERAGYWQVLNQYGENAYPLWQKNRGPLKSYQDMKAAERERNFIVIVRDVDCRFHGRWIRGDDFLSLPAAIQSLLTANSFGWSAL